MRSRWVDLYGRIRLKDVKTKTLEMVLWHAESARRPGGLEPSARAATAFTADPKYAQEGQQWPALTPAVGTS